MKYDYPALPVQGSRPRLSQKRSELLSSVTCCPPCLPIFSSARAYTTPKQGQVAAGARSAAPPLGKEALRVARIRKERAAKLERKMAR